MSTSATVLHNQTYTHVTSQFVVLDISAIDELVFSISCDQDSSGMWSLSRLDAFNQLLLFQEGPLLATDWSMGIGPSSSIDMTNALGDKMQIDITGANGSVSITLCVTGKAYT